MTDPLSPTPSLLCKLGSILVHIEEGNSPEGHHFDMVALDQLIRDPEVIAWRVQMDRMAMLPKKRKHD